MKKEIGDAQLTFPGCADNFLYLKPNVYRIRNTTYERGFQALRANHTDRTATVKSFSGSVCHRQRFESEGSIFSSAKTKSLPVPRFQSNCISAKLWESLFLRHSVCGTPCVVCPVSSVKNTNRRSSARGKLLLFLYFSTLTLAARGHNK